MKDRLSEQSCTPRQIDSKAPHECRCLESNIPGMAFLFTLHADGSYSFPYVTAQSYELFGLGAEDLMRDAHLLLRLLHPDDRGQFDAAVLHSAATLELLRQELRYIVNGEERWCDCMSRPEPRPDGSIAFRGIFLETTERKKAEADLRLTQFCVDQAAIGIFRIEEPDARIVSVNAQACRSLGYTSEELCSMTVFDIDPTFSKEKWLTHRGKIRSSGAGTIETVHRRKDGTTFPVEVSISYFHYQGRDFSFSFAKDITERKQAMEALRASEAKYRSVVDNLGIGIALIDPEMRVLSVNKVGRERFPHIDFSSHPVCYQAFNRPPRQEPCSYCAVIQTFADGEVHETVTETPTDTGVKNFRNITSPLKDSTGKVTAVVEMSEDITEKVQFERERESLEKQLRQAQKMEAVGTLAGGVAHDFNNMLSVIIGYTELLKMKLSASDPLLLDILEIEKAAHRSKDTTRQLLAFSRQQTITPRPMDLADHIANLRKTLARLIGEDIDLRFHASDNLWKIKFDPSQLDQILINLAVNARDAMPQGGRLTIEVDNVSLDRSYCRGYAGLKPGRYILLEVRDTGVGMDRETSTRVFEPFFTTKEVGKGTGLGLATVYGIIKQNNGFIAVDSKPGQGAAFKIYLPLMQQEETPAAAARVFPAACQGGTILLVEDDELVRKMTTDMLERIGYTVVVATTPTEALSIYAQYSKPVDLLLTDVVMPEMNGAELRDRLAAINPGLKVLFMSGYSATVIGHHGVLDAGVHFLQKPFNKEELALKVQQAIMEK